MMLLGIAVLGAIVFFLNNNINSCSCIVDHDKKHLFCRECGKEIKPDYNYCPHCNTQLKKTCKTCGKMIDVSWRRCPYC